MLFFSSQSVNFLAQVFVDFSVFLFLFLSFSLFNSLSESADWGAELVAVESMSSSPLVPVVGGVVGVVSCGSSSNAKSGGSEAIMLSNSSLSGSSSAMNAKIDGENSSLEDRLPSAIAYFVCLRETIYSHKLEYAHVTCDTAHACSRDRARSAGNIIMFR